MKREVMYVTAEELRDDDDVIGMIMDEGVVKWMVERESDNASGS